MRRSRRAVSTEHPLPFSARGPGSGPRSGTLGCRWLLAPWPARSGCAGGEELVEQGVLSGGLVEGVDEGLRGGEVDAAALAREVELESASATTGRRRAQRARDGGRHRRRARPLRSAPAPAAPRRSAALRRRSGGGSASCAATGGAETVPRSGQPRRRPRRRRVAGGVERADPGRAWPRTRCGPNCPWPRSRS